MNRVDTPYGVQLLLPDEPAGEAAVADFESRIGHPLPDDYQQFLRMYNGGKPKPSGFRFVLRRGHYSDSVVNWLYAIGGMQGLDLEWNRDTFSHRMPRDLLPIGEDPGGNQICLGIAGDVRGKIYFWDHEREAGGDWSNVDLVADSFDAFLRGLTAD
jgi:hypothetical protein